MFTSGSWKIATIRGVELRVHISLFLLLIWLVFIASARFSAVAQSAGLDVAQLSFGPFAWGLIFAMALFVSVVLHEFGHVLVAQAHGVKAKSITLMMLGGVSQMEKMPEARYSEFKLAIMGPIVSFAIAGALFAVRELTSSPDLILFSYWLGSVNLVLAIFNLLPAFPLDGGRALRSVLAARQGMVRATQTSARISKTFAWILGVLGLLSFNIILMLIAFFVYTGAQSELFLLMSRGMLKGMRAGELATKIEPLRDFDSLSRATERMLAEGTPVLPVSFRTPGKFGVVTLNSIRRVPRDFWKNTLVSDVMHEVPKALDVDDSIGDSLAELASTSIGVLPVQENGQIIGLVKYSDVTEILQLKSLEEAEDMDRAA